jgi:hypothetical protein
MISKYTKKLFPYVNKFLWPSLNQNKINIILVPIGSSSPAALKFSTQVLNSTYRIPDKITHMILTHL